MAAGMLSWDRRKNGGGGFSNVLSGGILAHVSLDCARRSAAATVGAHMDPGLLRLHPVERCLSQVRGIAFSMVLLFCALGMAAARENPDPQLTTTFPSSHP